MIVLEPKLQTFFFYPKQNLTTSERSEHSIRCIKKLQNQTASVFLKRKKACLFCDISVTDDEDQFMFYFSLYDGLILSVTLVSKMFFMSFEFSVIELLWLIVFAELRTEAVSLFYM